MNRIKLALVVCALAGLAAVQPATAQDVGFKVFGAVSYVSPLSDSDIDIEGVVQAVEAKSETGWNAGFEWRASKLLGLEIDYTDATHDVEVGGSKIGEIGLTAYSASLNLHLIHTTFIDFYVGPTVAYVDWGDLETGDGDVSTDGETVFGASVGLDVGLGKNVALVGGVRYLDLDVNADGTEVSVNPLFTRVGVAYRW
jgi:outer membrane protein W